MNPEPLLGKDEEVVLKALRTHTAYFQREVASLFSGKNMSGNVIGLAWLGVMCNSLGNDCGGFGNVAYSAVGGHWRHTRLGDDVTLARIAAKHATTPYAIALAWLLAKGSHILPIPGATKVSSVKSSLSALDLVLDAGDLAALDKPGARRVH